MPDAAATDSAAAARLTLTDVACWVEPRSLSVTVSVTSYVPATSGVKEKLAPLNVPTGVDPRVTSHEYDSPAATSTGEGSLAEPLNDKSCVAVPVAGPLIIRSVGLRSLTLTSWLALAVPPPVVPEAAKTLKS